MGQIYKLVLAVPNGFFIFFNPPVFGWYLSSTAVVLIASWSLHNVIAWMKNKPFLTRTASRIYIGTVMLVQAYWVIEVYANFTYFNNINDHLFVSTRPWEALFRYGPLLSSVQNASKLTLSQSSDPWWIFTTINLLWNIKHRYSFGFIELIRVSPRFCILLLSMCFSVGFIIIDILSVISVLKTGSINPFWKFSFVFKCFTDTIVLDDFKTALDRLWKHKRDQMNCSALVSLEDGPIFEQLELGKQVELQKPL
ncbi:hypothetical protein H2198_003011 [Neophaeococcomyces mojaviensis]|uniref:Uncharacterized protein n=1 Tax=Neophaeococcomyces mojaviensis TaxID=3383035 RepID=A0ACC3ACG0_9EURO|nr:hypothetical protein H2198_003011 [Knufia sp. JES_112]